MLKRTPLFEEHQRLGAKLVPFAGWEMPIQYSSIIKEHNAVRNDVGLFDVSHMGEIIVAGSDAERFLQFCITNDITRITDSQAIYSPICYETGGIVDDLLVYKFSSTHFFVVVNASNIEKDFNWLLTVQQKYNFQNVSITNESDDYIQIAVQGPNAEKIMQKEVSVPLPDIKFYHFTEGTVFGKQAIVSRTGYTGEDGFEFYLSVEDGISVWRKLIELGIQPCGLGARDTLRLESALPLYGNDMTDSVKPTETIIKWTVKLNKDNFIGKNALLDKPARKMYGFEMVDRGMPRHLNNVFDDTGKIGTVTSGGFAPFLKKYIGLALLDNTELSENDTLFIEIRDKKYRARICSLPFYSKKYKK